MSSIRSGVTKEQRARVRSEVDGLLARLSEELGVTRAALVLELRYYSQRGADPDRSVATATDKRRSLAHFAGICQGCLDATRPLMSVREAAFHHERRGFREQHEPANLKPFHIECHDREHDVPDGASVHKGAPRAKG
jgi:5-methylcytosine-specific restriction endonuclease McrA